MGAYGLMTMYNLTLSIGTAQQGTAPSLTWTYSPLLAGIENITEALNETVQQYFFMADQGFARNHATAMAPTFTLTGRRIMGDAAQDYIFSKKYGLDTARQSSVQLTYVNSEGDTVTSTCDCTLGVLQEWAGATSEDSAISIEIRLDGKPEVTTTPAE